MLFEIVVENVIKILATLLISLIGIGGAYLTKKLSTKIELSSTSAAVDDVIKLAQLTVDELQQTMVEEMKAAHEDGKLTKDEISHLGLCLREGVIKKMSAPVYTLIHAAGIDLDALIKTSAEAYIAQRIIL